MALSSQEPTLSVALPLVCHSCGAPLPLPRHDGTTVCSYCGVRSGAFVPMPLDLSGSSPRAPPSGTGDGDISFGPPYSHGPEASTGRTVVGILVFLLMIGAWISLIAATTGPTPPGAGGPYGNPSCSATISESPASGPAPLTVQFTAIVTDNESYFTSWDIGGGNGGLGNASFGGTATHTFDAPGTYPATLLVADHDGGCSVSSSVDVT